MSSAEPPPKPTPGWYPDPGGTGVQRYFDGTNWGQFAPPLRPPPPPPKKGISPKAIVAVIGAIFVLIIIGKACGSDDKNGGSTSPSSTSPSSGTWGGTTSTTPTYSEREIESAVIDTCQKAIKRDLKDPDSAKFADWKAWIVAQHDKPPKVTYHSENGDKLYSAAGSVNAKNGFGGYVGNQPYGCDASVTTSGNVHANAYPLEDILNPTATP